MVFLRCSFVDVILGTLLGGFSDTFPLFAWHVSVDKRIACSENFQTVVSLPKRDKAKTKLLKCGKLSVRPFVVPLGAPSKSELAVSTIA